MSNSIFLPPASFIRFLGTDGEILPFGKLYFYLTGTLTESPVYDEDGDVIAQPVLADVTGAWVNIYLDDSVTYRVRLENAAGVEQGDADPWLGLSSSGLSFIQSGTGAVATTVQNKLRQFLHAEDYGAVGDGVTDDTTALVNLLAAMKAQGKPGLLGGEGLTTTYLVETGALEWAATSTTVNTAGPVLFTAGRVILDVKSGSPDEPILYIHNESTTGGRWIHGGYIGPLEFSDTTGDSAPNRHAIQLYGVEFMRFAPMFSEDLKGDLFHIETKGSVSTGDNWHVFSCIFEGGTTWNTDGWTFNNDSLSQFFNGNHIVALWNITCAKGLFRGPGSCNTLDFVSTAGCGGWALDLVCDTGSTPIINIGTAELDTPENGIRMSGLTHGRIKGIRITLRRAAGVTSPGTCILLDEVTAGQVVSDCEIEVQYRIESASITSNTDLNTISSFDNNATVNRNNIVYSYVFTGAGFTPDDNKFRANINASSYANLIELQGEIIHDSRIKHKVRAYMTAGDLIQNSDYAAAGSILTYGNQQTDDGGDFDPATYKYTCPYTGWYRVRARIMFASATTTQVKMSVMSNTNSQLAEAFYYPTSASAVSYMIDTELQLTGGDTIWISAVQDTAGDIAISVGGGAVLTNTLEIVPI